MFRRFGDETTRLLLHKEIELFQLVEELHKLDLDDASNGAMHYRLKSIEENGNWNQERKELLDQFEKKIGVYYDLKIKFNKVLAMGDVKRHDHRAVWDWVVDNDPLDEDERAFLFKVDDFGPINREEKRQPSRVQKWIERYIRKHPKSKLMDFLGPLAERQQTDDSLVIHHSASRLAFLVRLAVGILAIASILIPILLMFLLQPGRKILAVIVCTFVFVFMAVASELVDFTPHELFILVAAYTAVLVTLLSNLMA